MTASATTRFMRWFGCLALLLMATPATAGSSTGGASTEQMAIAEAQRQVPRGATITKTECKAIGAAGNNDNYRCTVYWD
jgi:hypothetical protein